MSRDGFRCVLYGYSVYVYTYSFQHLASYIVVNVSVAIGMSISAEYMNISSMAYMYIGKHLFKFVQKMNR